MIDFVTEHLWTILFYTCVVLLVIIFRKKFDFQGIIALYRTKFGLLWMERIGTRYREGIKLIGLIGVGVGFIGMFYSIFLILQVAYKVLIEPIVMDGNPIILPGTTLAYTGGVVFPLVMGWITLFIVIVVHEFSHGVVARAHKIPVKSSGIAFFGPILGAFVEPDEKKIEKTNDVAQYSIFAAGPFSNFLLTGIVLLISLFLLAPLAGSMAEAVGVTITDTQEGLPAEAAGIEPGTVIDQVDGVEINDSTGFQDALKGLKPNETVLLASQDKTYNITAASNPDNASKGYLGVYIATKMESGSPFYPVVNWLSDLAFWVWFISLNVGIINLFPIFITDGARMLLLACQKLFPKHGQKIWVNINKLAILLFLIILFVPMLRSFL